MTTTVTPQKPEGGSLLEPMRTYVVAVESDAPNSGSGLVLPDAIAKKQSIATVQETGPDVKVIEPGDVIVYRESNSTELAIGRHRYILVEEQHVLARVRQPQDANGSSSAAPSGEL